LAIGGRLLLADAEQIGAADDAGVGLQVDEQQRGRQ